MVGPYHHNSGTVLEKSPYTHRNGVQFSVPEGVNGHNELLHVVHVLIIHFEIRLESSMVIKSNDIDCFDFSLEKCNVTAQ